MTDDERREVARRLKSIRGLDYCKDPRYAIELASDAIGASHSNGYSWDKMLDRLADLIEPSCDRAALATFARNLDLLALMVNSQELTNTGQIAGACQNIANGIREALRMQE